MGRRLGTYVHVFDGDGEKVGVFGPDDDVPAKAAALITNPDVWADEDQDESGGDEPSAPPLHGPGSGKEAWAAWAEHLGLTVPAGSKKDDIVALVEQAAGSGEPPANPDDGGGQPPDPDA